MVSVLRVVAPPDDAEHSSCRARSETVVTAQGEIERQQRRDEADMLAGCFVSSA
jgi:hypothetical protein